MKTEDTYCRLCDSLCGLIADMDNGQITALRPDKSDPVGAGFICDTAANSLTAISHPTRITEPMKRVNGRLMPTSWDEAIREIGSSLRAIRSKNGPSAIGLYLGDSVQRSSRALVRSLAFGVGAGTPHIFSEQCLKAGPRLWAAEQMIGHATPLLSDLSRAHYVLLLSGEQRRLGWGPSPAGMGHEAWLQHSRKTKGTKVIVADPKATELSSTMDDHLPIRPGSEPFLMLGMLNAIVNGGWTDTQFIRDYTSGFERLKEAIQPWTVERCSEICGIDAPILSGVALKFSRSAMSVIHPAAHSFNNAAGAIGAWAWMALHAVTANLLRPGGLYENRGAIDLFPVLTQMPTSKAPTTATTGHRLILMQAPATALSTEIREGPLQALISVGGDPIGTLPGTDNTRQALRELPLLVCISSYEDLTSKEADWILPAAHPWEQASLCLHDNVILPYKGTMWSTQLIEARGQARSEDAILSDLFAALKPGLRGSAWGKHTTLLGRYLAGADLAQWENRAFAWSDALNLDQIPSEARRIKLGDTDRSTWRPSTEDGRLRLLPEGVDHALSSLQAPPCDGLVLRTGQASDRAPDSAHREASRPEQIAVIHPDAGPPAGSRAQLSTPYGALTVTIRHEPALREDTVDLPFVRGGGAGHLLDSTTKDEIVGIPVLDGLPATLDGL